MMDLINNISNKDSRRALSIDMRCRFSNLTYRALQKIKLESYASPRNPIDPGIKSCREVTAVIFTCGSSSSFDKCLESVNAQTLAPSHIEIVRNLTPIDRAFQEGLERVRTPFYASVDDDMILYPRCFEQLYYMITRNSNRAEVVLGLDDPLLGPIQGIHFYRTDLVKPIGFTSEEKGPERRLNRKLREAGHECPAFSNLVVGQHHPVYSPLEAFWKYRFLGTNLRYHSIDEWSYYGTSLLFYHLDKLFKYWRKTDDLIAIYALAGLFDGLSEDANISDTLSYEGRDQHPEFQRLYDYLKDLDRTPKGIVPRVRETWRRLKDFLGSFKVN